MRQVVLDTETTGLEPELGHRIIEIGCIELVNRRPTGRRFHRYLAPGRDVESGAEAVHGLTNAFLADKPGFAEVADELLEFLQGAELVIHNAAFDIGFLDYELQLLGEPVRRIADCGGGVLDTLEFARELHPGSRNSLDALCKRYNVDNSGRELHGALLDAQLLAEVYLAMSGGQADLSLEGLQGARRLRVEHRPVAREGLALVVVQPSEAERRAHERSLAAIEAASGTIALWRMLEAASDRPAFAAHK